MSSINVEKNKKDENKQEKEKGAVLLTAPAFKKKKILEEADHEENLIKGNKITLVRDKILNSSNEHIIGSSDWEALYKLFQVLEISFKEDDSIDDEIKNIVQNITDVLNIDVKFTDDGLSTPVDFDEYSDKESDHTITPSVNITLDEDIQADLVVMVDMLEQDYGPSIDRINSKLYKKILDISNSKLDNVNKIDNYISLLVKIRYLDIEIKEEHLKEIDDIILKLRDVQKEFTKKIKKFYKKKIDDVNYREDIMAKKEKGERDKRSRILKDKEILERHLAKKKGSRRKEEAEENLASDMLGKDSKKLKGSERFKKLKERKRAMKETDEDEDDVSYKKIVKALKKLISDAKSGLKKLDLLSEANELLEMAEKDKLKEKKLSKFIDSLKEDEDFENKYSKLLKKLSKLVDSDDDEDEDEDDRKSKRKSKKKSKKSKDDDEDEDEDDRKSKRKSKKKSRDKDIFSNGEDYLEIDHSDLESIIDELIDDNEDEIKDFSKKYLKDLKVLQAQIENDEIDYNRAVSLLLVAHTVLNIDEDLKEKIKEAIFGEGEEDMIKGKKKSKKNKNKGGNKEMKKVVKLVEELMDENKKELKNAGLKNAAEEIIESYEEDELSEKDLKKFIKKAKKDDDLMDEHKKLIKNLLKAVDSDDDDDDDDDDRKSKKRSKKKSKKSSKKSKKIDWDEVEEELDKKDKKAIKEYIEESELSKKAKKQAKKLLGDEEYEELFDLASEEDSDLADELKEIFRGCARVSNSGDCRKFLELYFLDPDEENIEDLEIVTTIDNLDDSKLDRDDMKEIDKDILDLYHDPECIEQELPILVTENSKKFNKENRDFLIS
ncbi:MAG: hypothetical protein ACRCX2_36310 [Paraclostridium sp.]